MKRNQLIEHFKTNSLPTNRLLAMYFGFPFNEGQRNECFSDSMQAIYAQADDMIFFSSQLYNYKELSQQGIALQIRSQSKFGGSKPRIIQPDFSSAQDLLPDEKNYPDWFAKFVASPLPRWIPPSY